VTFDRYEITELNNGIRVISEYIPHFRSISLGFWIPAGSRNENSDISGVSHLIEHLVFKGTNKRSCKEIAIEFDLMGAEFNAFTDKENCCIYADFIDTHLDSCTELLLDILMNPSFLTEHIKTEKKVIIEEIKMVEDNPSDNIMNYFYETVLDGHPLSLPILGTKNSLKGIKKSTILKYFRDKFNIGSIVVSAAGNIMHKDLIDIIKKNTSETKSREHMQYFTGREPPDNGSAREVYSGKTSSVYMCFGGLGCRRDSKDKYPISLFTNLLGGSMSSRLFQQIREEEGLAYSIFSSNVQYLDTGIIIIYSASSPKNVGRILKLIKDEVVDIKRHRVKEVELERAKENLKGNIVLSVEDISSRMFRLGKGLLFDKKVLTINQILKKIDKVKRNDINDIVDKYFNLDKMSLVALGKINKGGLL
jgi:predicted Zn-dependent peptidase